MRCSWLKPGVAVAEDDADVVAVGDVAQRLRGGRVADHREPGMGAQERGREAAARGRQQHRPQRLGLAGARHEHEQLTRSEQRAQADGERLG
jgi:hypothetical protein